MMRDLEIFKLLPLFTIKNIAALINKIGIKLFKNSLDNLLTSKVPNKEPINDNDIRNNILFSFNKPFLK